jgi:hypothetical protein
MTTSTVITHNHYELNSIKELKDCPRAGDVLKLGCKILDSLDIKYWISSGTALGFYRDGDFILNDKDIDIGIQEDFHSQHLDELIYNLDDLFLNEFQLIRTQTVDGRPMQRAYIKDDVVFDLYFYYTGLRDGYLININENGTMDKPSYLFYPLKDYQTKYGIFKFPGDIEKYLLVRYGQNWRTPSNKKGLFTKEW